ncbi:AsnC family transcriptional regulator [Pseudobacteroides cellulosolvens]|uniref:siroheme decarboxylase n=1 Tax=Pseudobacteroides cellulosolvens ATCC 35603 = DSM 2933 TaxID=398512 RepID=A0A0L6JRN5_9FIRM|nr:AsnC family transcriptional regulator [Pseudobacteroides cellulosolvens]KNY28057.1 putative transcriptional regulator, AsnC family [Pseudobacteroides cellulosolvens ATCC 35603 = DSM 2933]
MLNDLDRKIIRILQEDILLQKEPFKAIAKDLDINEDALLERIHSLKEQKILRRIGAILHHRKAGFSHNAMVVWVVPEERSEEIGKLMASFSQISHCYKRVTFRDWPYNLYTMIHGQSKEECEEVVCNIAKITGVNEYEILYSTKELKKTSMKYFID